MAECVEHLLLRRSRRWKVSRLEVHDVDIISRIFAIQSILDVAGESLQNLSMELHDAVWSNDVHRLKRLLQSVQDCNVPDGESNWTPLHLALYYGHLRVALTLLKSGARLDIVDRQDRTPLDLISKELQCGSMYKTDVFSWGNGMNYQLGTGNTRCPNTPQRLEKLRGRDVQKLAVSKFHGLAVGKHGEVYSWGWGMGGRLGHPEAKLYSQGGAQLFPRTVDGLKDKCIVAVAVAKHHSLAVTSTGDVYSWGCNPDGRLGYPTGGNKRIVPKRLTGLKGIRVIQVSAANGHSAVVTDSGMVYTWGSNVQGQLGYGTSDSGCNVNPRPVDGLKHRRVTQISLAKHHTLALTEEGEVYSWGHKCVAPKRIGLNGSREREASNANGMAIQFHRGAAKVKKPLAVMIAAGVQQSCCLTASGVVLCWASNAPSTIKEVTGKLAGKKIISITASKYKTAAVTSNGQVYVWDAQHEPNIVSGMQNALYVAAGEQHFLALQRWNADLPGSIDDTASGSQSIESASENVTSIASELELETSEFAPLVQNKPQSITGGMVVTSTDAPPSLQCICEKAVVHHALEPRTVVYLLHYADTTGSQLLKRCCLHFLVRNLSTVLHESYRHLHTLTDDLLVEIEQAYQKQILGLDGGRQTEADRECICSRRPTYRFQSGSLPTSLPTSSVKTPTTSTDNRFLPQQESVQNLKKQVERKLKQIKVLERKEANGHLLDDAQLAKMARRENYEKALNAIHAGACYNDVQMMMTPTTQSVKEDRKTTAKKLEEATKKPSSMSLNVDASRRKNQSMLLATQMTSSIKSETKTKAKQSEEVTSKLPAAEPNLIPARPPKSRDIGRLPRFLEPSRQKRSLKGRSLYTHRDPTPEESMIKDQSKPKKWTTMELDPVLKSQRVFGFKAVPSKDLKKMSLSDFMVASDELPSPKEPVTSPKEPGPVWGGKHFKDVSSFRLIQEEQRNHRPGMPIPGKEVAVMQRRTVGRWQTHCDAQVQSIKCIQIEERAVQELSAKYGDAIVKIRPGTARESTKSDR